MPPQYDSALTITALNYLQFSVVFYLGFGYWMLSNKQIFSNDHIYPLEKYNDIVKTGHSLSNIEVDYAFPIFVLLILMVLGLTYIVGK